MAASDWQKIRDAFERCLELSESEWQPFLTRTFNGDESSQNEVIQLLDGDRRATSARFLDWDCGGDFDKRNTFRPGDQIGKYRVIERVGAGGSGVVYRVCSLGEPSRVYAIKTLHSWRSNDDGVRRFQREIEVLQQLEHPCIAPCIEYGFEEGALFLVMPYFEGNDLEQSFNRRDCSVRKRVELFREICRAIAYAHDHLVLHRDLKPGNIMIDCDGNPVVMDFGLAKLVGDRPDSLNLTTTGRIIGTPSYMAPEQTGTGGPATMTTDVYGLGAVLYFLLTGRPPFTGSNLFEIGQSIRTEKPESPRNHDSELDRDLNTVCLKCLEKQPADRYPTVSALIDDLDRYLEGIPVSAKRKSTGRQLVEWAQQNPWVSTFAILFLLSLFFGLLATGFFWRQSESQKEISLGVIRKLTEIVIQTDSDPKTLEQRAKQLRLITDAYMGLEDVAELDEENRYAATVSWFKLGRVEGHLGDTEASKLAYRKALEGLELLAEEEPDNLNFRFDIVHCLNSLERHDEALAQAELLVALGGGSNPDYLAVVGAELSWLATNRLNNGRFEEALAAAQRGLTFANDNFGPEGGKSLYRRRIADFHGILAMVFLVLEDLEKATAHANSAVCLIERLIVEYPNNDGIRRDLMRGLKRVHSIHFHLGNRENALASLEKLEFTCAEFFMGFEQFYHGWQAREAAYRSRWLFELEFGTAETAGEAERRYRSFLADWKQEFPIKRKAQELLAWINTHPDCQNQDFASARKLIETVLESNEPPIRGLVFEKALLRLDMVNSANEQAAQRLAYDRKLYKVLGNYFGRY